MISVGRGGHPPIFVLQDNIEAIGIKIFRAAHRHTHTGTGVKIHILDEYVFAIGKGHARTIIHSKRQRNGRVFCGSLERGTVTVFKSKSDLVIAVEFPTFKYPFARNRHNTVLFGRARKSVKLDDRTKLRIQRGICQICVDRGAHGLRNTHRDGQRFRIGRNDDAHNGRQNFIVDIQTVDMQIFARRNGKRAYPADRTAIH